MPRGARTGITGRPVSTSRSHSNASADAGRRRPRYTRAAMKPLLGVAIPFFHAFPPDEYVNLAKEIEERGYDTAWVGEAGGNDGITAMAVIASHTRTLRVANGILPVQTRTPTLLGQTAATLGTLAPGRIALGLGLSSPVIVGDWHGLRFSSSLDQLREAVAIVRAVLSGERVSHDGLFYRVKNFRLTAPPPPAPVKIYLSALGPKAVELAGEIADGVLLNWIPPEVVPESVRHLTVGARRAGRTLDGFEIAAYVRTCVTDDPDGARQWLARDITGYATVDAYARFFRASGFAEEIDALRAAWSAGDRAGAVKQISPRVLAGLGVIGTAEQCRARIEEFRGAGLTMPVVVPFAPVPQGSDPRPSLLRTIRSFGSSTAPRAAAGASGVPAS